MTKARELALADRVVAFAAGSRTLAPGQLDQPAVIKPCSGALVRHGGSLMGSRGPFVHVFEPKHNTTLTSPSSKRALSPHDGGPTP